MSVLLCNSACACVGALRHLYICTIMFLGIGGSVCLWVRITPGALQDNGVKGGVRVAYEFRLRKSVWDKFKSCN